MKLLKKRKIFLVFGKTGYGKSYYVKKNLIPLFNRVVICDPQFEYEGLFFYSFDDLINYHLNNNLESFKYVCRFTNDIDYDFLFKWCYITANLCLVVEEAEQYISKNSTNEYFYKLVRYGRHKDISIIAIARKATELSVEIRAQVNEIISFKQTEPLDLQRMQMLGFTGLENLNVGEFIIVNP